MFRSIFQTNSSIPLSSATTTENGALSLATTENPLVDLYFKLVRDIPDEMIQKLFPPAWDADPLRTLKLVFQTRDCRSIGKGDRKPFWYMINYMIEHGLESHLEKNLELLPEFGYWKDMLSFCGTPLEIRALEIMGMQLLKDRKNMLEGKPVSLAAKYAPTPKGSHDRKFGAVKKLIHVMKTLQYEDICAPKNESEYRVYFTSPLRDYLKIVERLMCAKSWDEIEFGRVPSIAMNRLKKVFERHEPERWKEYLEKLKEGKEKVQGKQLYPHEIVSQMMDKNNSDNSIILEKQWEQQLEKLTPETISQLQKTLVISDVSGSMNGTPMMVSIALGLLISSLLPEPWKDLLITFSNNPTFHKVCGETLQERIYNIAGMEWGGSTDLTKTFTMILEKCMQQEIPPSEMPDKILILSDMQFNESDRRWETNHQMIERKYLTNGYKMPQIIYWNLRGDTIDFPVNAKQFNVICISGYSPSILNAILNGKEPNPEEIVKNILDHERYERVSLSI